MTLYLVERTVTDRSWAWVDAPSERAARDWLHDQHNGDYWAQGGGEEWCDSVRGATPYLQPQSDISPIKVNELGLTQS